MADTSDPANPAGSTANDSKAPEQDDAMDIDGEQAAADADSANDADGKVDEEEEDDEEDDDDEEEDDEPVESLVSGRVKRSTAGSRYSQLLSAQMRDDADDEVALLFAEEGEDEDFEVPHAAEAEEDADQDDSSTDEEDQPGAEDDELAGEKQLEKEERAAKRARKRKAEQALSKAAPVRKKVKIDESANVSRDSSEVATTARPRAKRKSERVSWIPTEAEAPVRTSSRTLSVQNKERTIESMKESEARRIRQMHIIEKANRKRQAEKTKPKTQEERLAEAARVERQNSKSLNNWEQMEKERMERQKARLEALHNRTLEGPVIRWYSGRAEWVDGKLKHVGRQPPLVEVVTEQSDVKSPVRKKRSPPSTSKSTVSSKADPSGGMEPGQAMDAPKDSNAMVLDKHMMPEGSPSDMPVAAQSEVPATGPERAADLDPEVGNGMASAVPDTADPTNVDAAKSNTELPPDARREDGLLEGLEYYASLDENNAATSRIKEDNREKSTGSSAQDLTSALAIPEESLQNSRKTPAAVMPDDQTAAANSIQNEENHPAFVTSDTATRQQSLPLLQSLSATEAKDSSITAPGPPANTSHPLTTTPTIPPTSHLPPQTTQPPPPFSPPKPKIIEHATSNTLTLLNFASTTPDIVRRILFAWPSATALPNTSASLLSSYTSASTAGISNVSSTTPYGRGRHNKGSVHSAYSVLEPPKPVCAITGQRARYLDPLTGLPYIGIEEFRSLRKLAGTETPDTAAAAQPTDPAAPSTKIPSTTAPIWSSLLNAYVGPAGVRGPPDPIPPPPPPQPQLPIGSIQQQHSPPSPDPALLEAVRWRAAKGVSEGFVGGKVVPPAPLPSSTAKVGNVPAGGAGAGGAGTIGSGGSGIGAGPGASAVVVKTEGASAAGGENASTAAPAPAVAAQ